MFAAHNPEIAPARRDRVTHQLVIAGTWKSFSWPATRRPSQPNGCSRTRPLSSLISAQLGSVLKFRNVPRVPAYVPFVSKTNSPFSNDIALINVNFQINRGPPDRPERAAPPHPGSECHEIRSSLRSSRHTLVLGTVGRLRECNHDNSKQGIEWPT
jgi:hypothetical protein